MLNHQMIILHVPSEEAFQEADITGTYVVAERMEDGSCFIIFPYEDTLVRFRFPDMIEGCVVFPPALSGRPLEPRQVELLAHHGVVEGDSMEIALLKADKNHEHFHFHPDRIG